MGIFQVANGGTLFLDEIGELPFYLQAKLLRVIQENEIMRIGGTKPIPVDVRLITATNRNLWQMVQEGQFREDFYYRLNVVQIKIPPLRDRKEEIPVFVEYFLDKLNKKYNLKKMLDPMLIERLMDYNWPGNVREIKNAIEQAFVTSPGEIITELWLGPQHEKYPAVNADTSQSSSSTFLKDAMQEFESKLIKETLKKHGSTRKAAAELGVSQATIWRKAIQYGIELSEKTS
jgi:TyrR family helix-turn-helix protein